MEERWPKIGPTAAVKELVDDANENGTGAWLAPSNLGQDGFEVLLDESQFYGPGQAAEDCPTVDGVPLSPKISPERAPQSFVPYRRPLCDDDNRPCQKQFLPPGGSEAFYPFNDRYWIGEKIGAGGMGLVYVGWDSQLQRHVAIKIIRDDQKGIERHHNRFIREARIASRLSHPGILGIHDFSFDPSGSGFIIMDLITGKTMEKAIEEAVDCEPKRQSLLTIFFQICQAIAFAHTNGVVHRDLKPANVMVGDYGLAIVLDWGLAKVLDSSSFQSSDLYDPPYFPIAQPNIDQLSDDPQGSFKTKFGTVMGTPGYLAPEQARGEFVDYRVDVFSLGGMLCHLLTGAPPFVGEKVFDIYRQSVCGDLSHAFERLDRCGAPIPLVRLAKRCLDPDVSTRPETASFLVDGLKEYLESGQRRAEEELIRFFDLSLDLFCIANTHGYFWRINDNFTRTLGYPANELTSQPFIDFVHPDDRLSTLHEIVKLSRGEPSIQFINRYRHSDGHYISLEWTARSLESEGVVYAVARDISERIRLENEKCQIEYDRFRLSEIVDSACDAIIGMDLSGVVESWNLGAEVLFGYSAKEMIGKPIRVINPLERLHEESILFGRIRQGDRVDSFETVRIHKSGERMDISLSISPIRDAVGVITGASIIARSISKQRKLESDLEKSRTALIEFAENANVPLHCVDQTGTIVWANNAELSFLGYSRNEYVGQPIAKFHANEETIADIFSQLIQGKALSHYRAKLIAKDGSMKDVAIYSSPYQEDGKMIHTRCFTFDMNLPGIFNSNATER